MFKRCFLRKSVTVLLLWTLLASSFFFTSLKVQAVDNACGTTMFSSAVGNVPINGSTSPEVANIGPSEDTSITITRPSNVGKRYKLAVFMDRTLGAIAESTEEYTVEQADLDTGTSKKFTIPSFNGLRGQQYNVDLLIDGNSACRISSYLYSPTFVCDIKVYQNRKIAGATSPQKCYFTKYNNSCLTDDDPLYIEYTVKNKVDGSDYTGSTTAYINEKGSVQSPFSFLPVESYNGNYTLSVKANTYDGSIFDEATCTNFILKPSAGCPSTSDSCGIEAPISGPPDISEVQFELCKQLSGPAEVECKRCYNKASDGFHGVWTAVGCISASPENIIQVVIQMGIGLGGGVAILVTLVGGFLLTTSQGNPKQAEQAKEMITSAVIGLLFIIFSVVILQFIGVTVLRLPGFGT